MTNTQSTTRNDTDERKPSCAEINAAQNQYLSMVCEKKVNVLSCKCSGCETDNEYPIISSPNDARLLNTAFDGSGGFLANGLDSNWEVGKGTSTSAPSSWSPAQIVSSPNSAWVKSPFSNANWISNSANGSGGDNLYFRYRFNLGSSVNPATFSLMMDFYADNRVWEIFVNNVAQSTQPNGAAVLPQFPNDPPTAGSLGYVEGNQVTINLNNNWCPCNNEIIIHIRNPGDPTGFLAQNSVKVDIDETGCDCDCKCEAVKLPDIHPCISVAWGDSKCDCLETDDMEVLCINVCNCYSNVTFKDFSIGQILVTDMAGNPVENLPDGTPSVQVIPSGRICFGDIRSCENSDIPSCISRELVLKTCGAIGKDYRLTFNAICFSICHEFQLERCFTMKLCQD